MLTVSVLTVSTLTVSALTVSVLTVSVSTVSVLTVSVLTVSVLTVSVLTAAVSLGRSYCRLPREVPKCETVLSFNLSLPVQPAVPVNFLQLLSTPKGSPKV